jgi:hypothetical protein
VTAVPDFAIGASLLVTWIEPSRLGERAVDFSILTMLLEFVIVHSSAIMGVVALGHWRLGHKLVRLLGLGLLYTAFVGAWAYIFGTWWPLVTFWVLTLNRILGVLTGQAPEGREKTLLQQSWATSGVLYLVAIFATTLLPVPALGITAEVIEGLDLTGEGIWVDQPYRVVAAGFLYFTGQGICELQAERWLDTRETTGRKKKGPA